LTAPGTPAKKNLLQNPSAIFILAGRGIKIKGGASEMRRFWGNHPGVRQARGFRKVKPATLEERLASMERELERRIKSCGNRDYWYVQMQREAIVRELERQQSASKVQDQNKLKGGMATKQRPHSISFNKHTIKLKELKELCKE
jgi:hypothetical protein